MFDEEKLKAKRARDDQGMDEDFDMDGGAGGDKGGGGGDLMGGGEAVGGGLGAISAPAPGDGGGGGGGGLLDLDDIFAGGATPAPPAANGAAPVAAPAPPAPATTDLLADIFSTPAAAPATAPGMGDPFGAAPAPAFGAAPPAAAPVDLFGGGTPLGAAPMGAPAPSVMAMAPTPMAMAPSNPVINAFEKNGLKLTMELTKTDPTDVQKSDIKCVFTNTSMGDVTNLNFQAAVPKFITLAMKPPSSTTVPANGGGTVEQIVTVKNSQINVKKLMVRMKISYTANGQNLVEQAQVADFPAGY